MGGTISRTVDAYLEQKLVGSYPVQWTLLNQPPIDEDAVELAKQDMQEDGFTADEIESARFVVRPG